MKSMRALQKRWVWPHSHTVREAGEGIDSFMSPMVVASDSERIISYCKRRTRKGLGRRLHVGAWPGKEVRCLVTYEFKRFVYSNPKRVDHLFLVV